jgi:hypothetical protein
MVARSRNMDKLNFPSLFKAILLHIKVRVVKLKCVIVNNKKINKIEKHALIMIIMETTRVTTTPTHRL